MLDLIDPKIRNMKFLYPIILLLASCSNPERFSDTKISYVQSENTKRLSLPFSDAVIVDNMIYLSGSLGNIPGTMDLVPGGIRGETIQTMNNIKAVLKSNGANMDDIIKCTVMIDDISQWSIFNEEYIKFFPNHKPARSAFGAEGLALGAAVEVECIACLRKR